MVVDQSRKIFHESWYRIANQKIALRSSVRIHRQYYRGVLWYVLYEPFTSQFFRFRENAYEFIVRLSLHKTVEEIWYELLELYPDDAPGQGDIVNLLSTLYQANMLYYNESEDSSQLLERKQTKKNKKIKGTLLNILFIKIPLIDPYPLLKRLQPIIKITISKITFVIWFLLILYAAKVGIENFETLKNEAQGFLSPSNLIWIYACTVFIKIFHEFGHSFAVHRYGGEVHTLGVMFMLLAPLPYMDATASWAFRKKSQRILVGCGGMVFEFFIAAIALIIWSYLGGGTLKAIAYNVFFIASISTLLFNANPLMRFDGYYILTDILDMPNLQKQSKDHLKYILEHYFLKKTDANKVSFSLKESFIYSFYGIASSIYKIILFSGIVIAISNYYLIISLIMGVLLIITMILTPLFHFMKYIFTSSSLILVRTRAITITLFFIGLVYFFLFTIPIPDTMTAHGILEAERYENVVIKTNGKVKEITSFTNTFIDSGASLLVLENPILENLIDEKKAAITEIQYQYKNALNLYPENMMPLSKRIEVLNQELNKLLEDKNNLILNAPLSGIFISDHLSNFQSKWLSKGDSIGFIIDTSRFIFSAVIPQEEAGRIFNSSPEKIKIRLIGNAFSELAVRSTKVIPLAQNQLPSVALGWLGGGEVEVNTSSENKTVEPFYLIKAQVQSNNEVLFLQGRSGKIHFELGTKPLGMQIIRKIRQALQKYYRI